MRKRLLSFLCLLLGMGGVIHAQDYEINQRLTSIDALQGKKFAIVNESTSNYLCIGAGHDGMSGWDMAPTSLSTAVGSNGCLFELSSAQGSDVTGYYYLRAYDITGTLYSPTWLANTGYLNSQPAATGDRCFALGITNNPNGQDIANGGVWALEVNGDGKFAIKNIGTGKYLKDAWAPAKFDDPTYFTFCTLKEASGPQKKWQPDQVFTNIAAGDIVAIYNPAEHKYIYGSEDVNSGPQNANYNTGDRAFVNTNSGYLFKVVEHDGHFLFWLQKPNNGGDYSVWGKEGYLNSQPADRACCFILGISDWSNPPVVHWGQDGDNLALWDLVPSGNGFKLKNVGTGKFMNTTTAPAKFEENEAVVWTFCTVKKALVDEELSTTLSAANELVSNPYKTQGKDALNAAIGTAQTAYNNVSSLSGDDILNASLTLKSAIARFIFANYATFAGSYYVQHAASGKYMAAGHNYGTHAIVNESGLDLTLTVDSKTKKVTFDSQVFNGDSKHFMGVVDNQLYMDSPAYGWYIEQVGEDTYAIGNGSQYIGVDGDDNLVLGSEPVAWKFLGKDALEKKRMADGLAALSEASEKNPVDATFLLKDANFNRNDHRWVAWSKTGNNINLGGGCSYSNGNGCAEVYHSAFDVKQTINGAPAGLYKMEAQGFYRQDDGVEEDNPVFYITDGTHEDTKRVPVRTGEENSMSDASVSFSSGLYECNPLEGKITGKLTVGVRGTATHQWVIWDNFRLTYYGPIPADVTLMDPVMATAKKMAADPYKTEGKEALQEAITAAQTAVAYSASYNYTEFEAEVKKLQAAVDAFAKANRIVKEGTFYVQHVNSGKYMAAGHNYGTRGIVNETGIDLTLAANADNTVTVDTKILRSGVHFLGSNLYMDSDAFNWWIGKYEDGTFSLSNGTQYVDVDDEGNLVFVDNPVGWQFITPENWQKAQLAKLDAATPENGVDATFLLKNPNFNRNDQRVSAWTTSGSNINLNGGNQLNNCGEAYHSQFTVSQKVEGARSGIYVLEAQGFYRQDGDAAESTPEFFIKDNTKNVENDSVKMAVTVSEEYKAVGEGSMSSASELFSEGKYDHKLAQCKIKGDFTVGVRTKGENQWVIFDNFRLTYYGPIPAELGQMEPVLAEAKKLAAEEMKTEGKDALNAAITAAEASAANYATLTYDQFEKEVDKLKTAIEAFKKANRKRMTGVYYVQNVASGKFMSAGHNWGTQAIVDEVGLDMTLKANSKDNKVSFDSQVSNGGNNHFLNSGLYMDGTSFDWSIEKMGDNVYSISDGTKFINVDENDNLVMSEEPAAWRFVTLEERMATLEDASEDDGVDATFLVKDYNLGRNNQRVSGWTVSDDCNKNFMTLGGPADKNIANYSGETWHTTFTISQTLNEMPIGIYGLKAQGFYRQDGEVAEAAPVFFINEERKELPVLTGETGNMEGAAIVLGNGEYAMEEPILCTVKDGQITLGVNGIASSQWVSFDNFRLIYYGLSGEDVTNPPVAKKDLTYTGKSQVLIEAGSHEVGEIQYSLDKENFSTELPQATNAGSYSIWYRVVDENNEPLLSVKKITANIAPVNATDYISMELADAGTTYTYDATAKEPEVIVKGGIKGLTAGTDYVVTYEDNVNAGTAKAIVTGIGNYKGTIVAPFNIEKAEMTLLVLADTVLVYNEEEQTVELDSVMAGKLMIPADAYTVEGNVQSAVGRYTVVVTANEESNFVGELTAEFEIIGRDIAGCEMTLKSYKEYFTGYERKPAVVVTRDEVELTEGVDYILSYENNVNVGIAKAIVAGIGNYSGTNEQEFTIVTGDGQLTMLNDTVTISYITTGFSVRPIKLTGDGNLTYTSSNEEVAQVNYKTGEITINNVGETIITAIMKNTKNATSDTITCLLVVKPASEWQVTAIRTSSIYELPAFRVTSSKETLVEGRDYTMSYKNLEGREVTEAEMVAESGMYTAVVNLKGNYTGTIERDILVQITATDIDGVKGDLNGKIRYDMSGRRVKNYRGIVIEDGQVRAVKK